ncbi:MAG: prolipoprotein diacylglyceryl transferase [Limimaricola sp.]|uniref:prolipoprotein diacylglyceryl transferase n=1 Tax=Limimaricola sp. TaxID=2211665 RepID=UPI001D516125|nr:prolipoprotein diacylglyceryl transferase [Limimaricola sp.]MBI1417830.1 prolipoprotein diacylglyceryl transferase [Limimaricola sp.]
MFAAIPFPNVSPEVFTISLFGMHFPLRWYALAYITGIVIGWRIALMALNRPRLWPGEAAPMTPLQLENLMTWIIVGIIAGGRLGYVILYKPAYYLSHPVEIPILWEGGMSFHGGFLGVAVAILIYTRVQKLRLGSVADLIALATPPGLMLGRIANFINGELWGRQTDLPWGVIFPGEAAQSCATLAGPCARHPSQLYEAALEGLLLGTLLLVMAFRRGALKKPWLIAGTFFAAYGAIRFALEFVRQPDAQFQGPGNPLGLAFQWHGYGLTMGQALSLPMVLVGLAVVMAARRAR